MRTRTIGMPGLFLVLMGLLGVLLACAPTPAAPPAPPPAQTTQFALQAPAGAKVVTAFSEMDAACLEKTEWTVEVTPDTWLDVGIIWYAKDGPTAQENWKHLSIVITLDGKEIKDLGKYYHVTQAVQTRLSQVANLRRNGGSGNLRAPAPRG